MTVKAEQKKYTSFRAAVFLALFAGVFGLAALLIMADADWVVILMLATPALCLFLWDANFTEHDRARIQQARQTAFGWQFFTLFFAFAVISLLRALRIAAGVLAFLSLHWIALILLTMCVLAGLAGLRKLE